MMECVRLIIGEERERERDKQEVGRSIDPEQPGRLRRDRSAGDKEEKILRLPTPPTPRVVVSLHSDHNKSSQVKLIRGGGEV